MSPATPIQMPNLCKPINERSPEEQRAITNWFKHMFPSIQKQSDESARCEGYSPDTYNQ